MSWNPDEYTIEHQLADMVKGYDVTTDDDAVIKGRSTSDGGYQVDTYVPSDSDRGHLHATTKYDSDGNLFEPTHIVHY